jgi:hypothetical protein
MKGLTKEEAEELGTLIQLGMKKKLKPIVVPELKNKDMADKIDFELNLTKVAKV